MTKLETILSYWEEAGFNKEEIKNMIDPDYGYLILPDPGPKYTLQGYEQASRECLIKGVGFMDGGFAVMLDSLAGIGTNNGWIKIEKEEDLPVEVTLADVIGVNGIIKYKELIRRHPMNVLFNTHWRRSAVERLPFY